MTPLTPALRETLAAHIGHRIGRSLLLAGVSREAVAQGMGTSSTRLARAIKGSSDLSAVELVWLARALGTTVDALLEGR